MQGMEDKLKKDLESSSKQQAKVKAFMKKIHEKKIDESAKLDRLQKELQSEKELNKKLTERVTDLEAMYEEWETEKQLNNDLKTKVEELKIEAVKKSKEYQAINVDLTSRIKKLETVVESFHELQRQDAVYYNRFQKFVQEFPHNPPPRPSTLDSPPSASNVHFSMNPTANHYYPHQGQPTNLGGGHPSVPLSNPHYHHVSPQNKHQPPLYYPNRSPSQSPQNGFRQF
eukprot:g3973.t1